MGLYGTVVLSRADQYGKPGDAGEDDQRRAGTFLYGVPELADG